MSFLCKAYLGKKREKVGHQLGHQLRKRPSTVPNPFVKLPRNRLSPAHRAHSFDSLPSSRTRKTKLLRPGDLEQRGNPLSTITNTHRREELAVKYEERAIDVPDALCNSSVGQLPEHNVKQDKVNEMANVTTTTVDRGLSPIHWDCAEEKENTTLRKPKQDAALQVNTSLESGFQEMSKSTPNLSEFRNPITTAEAIEQVLDKCNSNRVANMPLLVMQTYTPSTNWSASDEVEIHEGTIVNALYKHKQWIYVKTPSNTEGFVPYSHTIPLSLVMGKEQSSISQCLSRGGLLRASQFQRCRKNYFNQARCGSFDTIYEQDPTERVQNLATSTPYPQSGLDSMQHNNQNNKSHLENFDVFRKPVGRAPRAVRKTSSAKCLPTQTSILPPPINRKVTMNASSPSLLSTEQCKLRKDVSTLLNGSGCSEIWNSTMNHDSVLYVDNDKLVLKNTDILDDSGPPKPPRTLPDKACASDIEIKEHNTCWGQRCKSLPRYVSADNINDVVHRGKLNSLGQPKTLSPSQPPQFTQSASNIMYDCYNWSENTKPISRNEIKKQRCVSVANRFTPNSAQAVKDLSSKLANSFFLQDVKQEHQFTEKLPPRPVSTKHVQKCCNTKIGDISSKMSRSLQSLNQLTQSTSKRGSVESLAVASMEVKQFAKKSENKTGDKQSALSRSPATKTNDVQISNDSTLSTTCSFTDVSYTLQDISAILSEVSSISESHSKNSSNKTKTVPVSNSSSLVSENETNISKKSSQGFQKQLHSSSTNKESDRHLTLSDTLISSNGTLDSMVNGSNSRSRSSGSFKKSRQMLIFDDQMVPELVPHRSQLCEPNLETDIHRVVGPDSLLDEEVLELNASNSFSPHLERDRAVDTSLEVAEDIVDNLYVDEINSPCWKVFDIPYTNEQNKSNLSQGKIEVENVHNCNSPAKVTLKETKFLQSSADSSKATEQPKMFTKLTNGPMLTILYDFAGEEEDDLVVKRGETVQLLNNDDQQWFWVAKHTGARKAEGFIPASYCIVAKNQTGAGKKSMPGELPRDTSIQTYL